MSRIIKVSDINSTQFYQLPKAFFHNPQYKEMKNDTKIAYSILRDLLELSIKNGWVNDKGEVYVKLSRQKLMSYLNIKGEQKITQIFKELRDKELIVENRVGFTKCNEIYVCIPSELEDIYSDNDLVINDDDINSLTFENQRSENFDYKATDIRKSKVNNLENQRHTKTNITKTNITNKSDVLANKIQSKLAKDKITITKEKVQEIINQIRNTQDLSTVKNLPAYLTTCIRNYIAEKEIKQPTQAFASSLDINELDRLITYGKIN